MSTALIIWVIVAVVAVGALAVVVWFTSQRSSRDAEADRARAAELRQEADVPGQTVSVEDRGGPARPA